MRVGSLDSKSLGRVLVLRVSRVVPGMELQCRYLEAELDRCKEQREQSSRASGRIALNFALAGGVLRFFARGGARQRDATLSRAEATSCPKRSTQGFSQQELWLLIPPKGHTTEVEDAKREERRKAS